MKYSPTNFWPRRWLMLGVAALAIAGLFSLILVIARTPQLAGLKELFSVALVVHVDLSVLVWFLAVMGTGMVLFIQRFEVAPTPVIMPASWWCMTLGTAAITLAPLTGEWEVIKSNYIPVLYNGVFFLGLALVASATLLMVLQLLLVAMQRRFTALTLAENSVEVGWVVLALILLLALFMFFLSGDLMPPDLGHEMLYEVLFWAGGHTLQFAYTLIMMLAWLVLAAPHLSRPVIAPKVLLGLWLILLMGAAYPLVAYLRYPVEDPEFMQIFTNAMIYWGGLAPGILWLFLAYGLFKYRARNPAARATFSALIMSMILFAAGGILGLMIQGQNVMIPAHYHGAIVAVTLALMGYAYTLLPQFGYRQVTGSRLAFWQPVIYGVGQLMHIGGLGYSGGYGVLRKTAAAGQSFAPEVQVALGVMGMGGLLAIVGGFLFVVVIWRAARKEVVSG
ncbi:MAG: cbb3-type cytochrome c oxidase subunit I [Alphaproteobacteria bacterium]